MQTVSGRDILGRVTQISMTDGSTVAIAYNDNTTTTTDETNNQRKTQHDGLGRVTAVIEDPNGLKYETDYQYNALDDLVSVVQKGGDASQANWRTRAFQYDSLSRLLSTTNPESGTISYTYDANSNVSTKTAPTPNKIPADTQDLSLSQQHTATMQ